MSSQKIKFRYTQWGNKIFNGIAFKEDEDVVVNFRLGVGKGSIDAEGKSWSIVSLETDARVLGVKVFDFFDRIISKYGKRDHRYPSTLGSTLKCYWHVYDDKLPQLMEEIKKALKKAMDNQP